MVDAAFRAEDDVRTEPGNGRLSAHELAAIKALAIRDRGDVLQQADSDLPGPATFVDAAIDELTAEIQRDPRSLALVERSVIDRFLVHEAISDRLHLLPAPDELQATNRAFSWCRRAVQKGRRPILVMTGRTLQSLFGIIRERFCLERIPARLIVVPEEPGEQQPPDEPRAPRTSVLAFLRLLPNTTIVAPKDAWELRQMLLFAAGHDGPVALHLPRGPIPALKFPDFEEGIESGRAEVLEDGDEIVLLTLGALAASAVRAAEVLSRQGISAGVVNARFVEPLDRSLIGDLAARCRGLVTLEEESASGGFGTAVLELLADLGIATPVTVSGAAGFDGGGAEADVVQWIVRQAVRLVDRANGLLPQTSDGRARSSLGGGRDEGIDLFGFSREALQREQDLVRAHQLSPQVEEFYQIYSQVGTRKRFLWQWCEQGSELTTLPCVLPELFRHVNDTKLLSMILCVLLDDVADLQGRAPFLELLLRVVDGDTRPDLSGCSDEERRYTEVTRQLTEIWYSRLRSYPSFETFQHLLRYDQVQYYNAMRYSHMLNRNLWAMNQVEHDLYLPHAMDMMSFATTDLMATVEFPLDELGRLREALWHLQCMGRVGNLLSTWRREIHQRDFASGVFARAVIEGDLSVGQLRPDNYGEIEAAIVGGGHERYYFGRWKYHRECFLAKARYVHAVDLRKLVEASDRLFLMHLGGRGLI
jgi:transketolase C-terminal domain/subunit